MTREVLHDPGKQIYLVLELSFPSMVKFIITAGLGRVGVQLTMAAACGVGEEGAAGRDDRAMSQLIISGSGRG